jgi:sterol desaturase/sphingolipid hydroxylase (fatty acid hydroxylase superfamily)
MSNLLLMLVYKSKNPFFERFKVQKDVPWPWDSDYATWLSTLRTTLKVVILNNLLIVPAILFINVILNNYQVAHSFSLTDLPSSWTYLWQLYFCILGEDLVFTFTHRLLHTPYLYKHVHKWHHTYI